MSIRGSFLSGKIFDINSIQCIFETGIVTSSEALILAQYHKLPRKIVDDINQAVYIATAATVQW